MRTVVNCTAQRLARELGDWRADVIAGTTYRMLADRIRLLTLDGRLVSGTRLPATRELAETLRVSRATVTAAYAALRSAGLLQSIRGSGSVLLTPAPPSADPGAERASQRVRWDLTQSAPGAPAGLASVFRDALEDLPHFMTGMGLDPHGLPELRAAVAAHYSRRGLPTGPAQIMITLGAQHGLRVVADHLQSPGGRVLIEQPTYPHAMDVFRALRARFVPVPVDVHGHDVNAVIEGLRSHRPALAYLMPDFHNPTGASFSEESRESIAAAAFRSGTTIIADETTALLDVDRGPRIPLGAFGDHIISLGSLSKTIWGGLRIGWVRARADTIEALRTRRRAIDLGTPILEQLVATRLLADEARYVCERSAQLATRRRELLTGLRERFSDWDIPDPDGGPSLWVATGEISTSNLALTAREQGVALVAGPRFALSGAFDRHLRLPLLTPLADVPELLDILHNCAAEHAQRPLANDVVQHRRGLGSATIV